MTRVKEDLKAIQLRDRRMDRRVSLIQEIECKGETGTLSKRLADISAGGIFIEGLTGFEPDDVVTIRFRLADSDNPIVVRAKVLYTQEKIGTGVHFLDLRREYRKRIEHLVDQVLSLRKRMGGRPGKLSRVLIRVPVTLMGTARDGESFEAKTSIVALAKNGACVRTTKDLELGTAIFLQIPKGSRFEGRVTWMEKDEIWVQCRSLSYSLGFRFP